jgi:queuine tRNA-ribosyltransferase
MAKPKFFHTITGQKIPLPIFFPDATRAVLKTLDSSDLEDTHTPGVLVNTFHLHQDPGASVIDKLGGVRNFMSWSGGVISDSGGFQVLTLAKSINDKGVYFNKGVFTPQNSIEIQLKLKTDMVVVLDHFTDPKATKTEAEDSVNRTLRWAEICKKIFDQKTKNLRSKPYLLGVVQGGDYLELRKVCTQELVKIGFDGLGYGGWPIQKDGRFNYAVSDIIRQYSPDNYFLYGLGIGKPHEIVNLIKTGWSIFDCVLPTRDARHRRLYVYNAKNIRNIDVNQNKFYSFFTPDKEIYHRDHRPVSSACDCLLCCRYSRSYLAHLFRIQEMTAGRLATIHNLRFYSLLMEKLQALYASLNS